MHVILAKHEEFPEDDELTSKHVGANHMKLYVIKVLKMCNSWSNYTLQKRTVLVSRQDC